MSFQTPDLKSREVLVRDPVKLRNLARSQLRLHWRRGRWGSMGSLFVCGPSLRFLPWPSPWVASCFFVRHLLPEKWSLSPSLDTVRSSEEESWVLDFEAARERPVFKIACLSTASTEECWFLSKPMAVRIRWQVSHALMIVVNLFKKAGPGDSCARCCSEGCSY